MGSVGQLSVRMGAGCWTVPGRMVASPFSRPLGETDAPAPVRAKERVWERGRVRNRSGQLARAGVTTPSPQSSPLIQGERRGVAGGVGSHAVPTELGLIWPNPINMSRLTALCMGFSPKRAIDRRAAPSRDEFPRLRISLI